MGSAFFVEEAAPARLLDDEEVVDISDLVDPEHERDRHRHDRKEESPRERDDRVPAFPVFPGQEHAVVFEVVERSGVPLHGFFRLADAGNLHMGRVDDGELVEQPVASAKVRLELHDIVLETEESSA